MGMTPPPSSADEARLTKLKSKTLFTLFICHAIEFDIVLGNKMRGITMCMLDFLYLCINVHA